MFNFLPLNFLNIEQVNIFVTFILLGLIWVVQLVHYPSFQYIKEDEFVKFEKFHTLRIALLATPLMLLEVLLGATLIYVSNFSIKFIVAFLFVIAIWISTFMLSVPCHKKLLQGKDVSIIKRLVATNWLRTFFWTAKSYLLVIW